MVSFTIKLTNAINEAFVNKQSIVFHVTDVGNLRGIIEKGLGSEDRSPVNADAMGGDRSLIQSGAYTTRYLGTALYYSTVVGNNACVLALRWLDTSRYNHDEDESFERTDGDDKAHELKNFVISHDNMQLMYAWILPNIDRAKVSKSEDIRINHFDDFEIPDKISYLFGTSAIQWLDRRFEMVYDSKSGM